MNLARKMVAVKINTDKSPEVGRKYGVQMLPTVLFLDYKGRKVHELVGFLEPDAFAKEMEAALARAR